MFSDEEIRRRLDLTDLSRTTFVKQYGAERSGTNAVRALILQNFTNTFVLMNILGGKHRFPVDLDRAYDDAVQGGGDESWRFVLSATHAEPSDTTLTGDYQQHVFLRALHAPITAAFREQRLYYVVSVRNPYAWASSLLRFRRWPDVFAPQSWEHRAAAEMLADACRHLNDCHRAWFALHERHTPRSIIMPCERLKHGWTDLVSHLEGTMSLTRREPELRGLSGPVAPTYWDYLKSQPHNLWFDLKQLPPIPLTERLHDVVTAEIDWALLVPFGYRIEPWQQGR